MKAASLKVIVVLVIFATFTTFVIFGQIFSQERFTPPPEFSAVKFIPEKITNAPIPKISATSVLLVDLDSDFVIYQKNPSLKLPPASLTKLATALVVSENCQADKTITVSKKMLAEGTKMGLTVGEQITIENLLYGLLLPSGNDAANALTIGCFGNIEEFLLTVTELTQKLGMINTHFNNPSGLPAKNHYSTAGDLLKLTKATIANSRLAEIVKTRQKVVTDTTGKISHKLENLNELLQDPQVLGVKTGRVNSGENLIILKNVKGHNVVSIVLQSQDRFSDTEKLFGWVEENFAWKSAVETVELI